MEWMKDVPKSAPSDGRYYVAWLVNRNDQPCLLAERPATRSEAQRFLKDFARDYRTKPLRITETQFDDTDGMWAAQRRGFPDGLLHIIHPDSLELLANRIEPSDLFRQTGFLGKVTAVEDPDAFFTNDWSITRPTRRTVVDVPAYGELLNLALRLGSPLEDLDPTGLDALRDAAQAVADHQPADPGLAALDASSLEYLSRRLTQAKIDGMSTAAFFNVSDRSVRKELGQAEASADQHVETSLAALQGRIRSLFSQGRALFEALQLDNSTLTWLYLDDIVDSRDYS
jgi:hypothetical protein